MKHTQSRQHELCLSGGPASLTGRERVETLLKGDKPDRVPTFAALRNDAVISHFGGAALDETNAWTVIRRAAAWAADATCGLPKLPVPPIQETLPDGRPVRYHRWFRWAGHLEYADLDSYTAAKCRQLDQAPFGIQEREEFLALFAEYQKCQTDWMTENAFFWVFTYHDPRQFGIGSRSFFGSWLADIYEEIGIDRFCLWLYQDTELFVDLLDHAFERSMAALEAWPSSGPQPLGLWMGDDMAFKQGPIVPPWFIEQHYAPRLRRVVEGLHARGARVLLHTDGDLTLILRPLVEAGIDILNPIERNPNMTIPWLRRHFPKLVLCGGVDLDEILIRGTPEMVHEEARRVIDQAEGRLILSATSLLINDVPLENYLAMCDAAHGT